MTRLGWDVTVVTHFQFYIHLFIGRSAVASGTVTVTSNASMPSKNRAWGLTQITPAIIAYVHVMVCVSDTSSSLINHTWQMYFTMSTAPRWCTVIGNMDLCQMVWNIMELLGGKGMDSWSHETLAWWNSYVILDYSTLSQLLSGEFSQKTKLPGTVTTVTEPTPIRPIPTCLRPSQVI